MTRWFCMIIFMSFYCLKKIFPNKHLTRTSIIHSTFPFHLGFVKTPRFLHLCSLYLYIVRDLHFVFSCLDPFPHPQCSIPWIYHDSVLNFWPLPHVARVSFTSNPIFYGVTLLHVVSTFILKKEIKESLRKNNKENYLQMSSFVNIHACTRTPGIPLYHHSTCWSSSWDCTETRRESPFTWTVLRKTPLWTAAHTASVGASLSGVPASTQTFLPMCFATSSITNTSQPQLLLEK